MADLFTYDEEEMDFRLGVNKVLLWVTSNSYKLKSYKGFKLEADWWGYEVI